MKTKAPQMEIGFTSEPFALVPESTLDGDALAAVAKQRKQDRAEAEAKQTTMQNTETKS